MIKEVAETMGKWIYSEETTNYWNRTIRGKGDGYRHTLFAHGNPTNLSKRANPTILYNYTPEREQTKAVAFASRFTQRRIDQLSKQIDISLKEQERLWKYTTKVLVPEAFIHQLTTRYDMDLRLADDIYTEHLKPPEKRDEHEILIDLEERVEEIQEENNDEIQKQF